MVLSVDAAPALPLVICYRVVVLTRSLKEIVQFGGGQGWGY